MLRNLVANRPRPRSVDWSKLDWNNMGIDWASAYAAGLAAQNAAKASSTPVPSATEAASSAAVVTPAAVQTSASSTSDLGDAIESAVASLWNDLVGFANDITSFGTEVTASGSTGDFYSGNYGSPYGHNMMKVSSRSGYDYTNEFINTSGETITVVIWNKVGPDGQLLSGSALAPTKPSLTFALKAGASQIVAFQENSQVGWAQACDAKAASGAFATSWGEANFVKTGSGYDLSAIMNPNGNDYNMALSSTEVTCISDMTQNYWLKEYTPIGNSDGSCYVPSSTVTLTTKMGGYV